MSDLRDPAIGGPQDCKELPFCISPLKIQPILPKCFVLRNCGDFLYSMYVCTHVYARMQTHAHEPKLANGRD